MWKLPRILSKPFCPENLPLFITDDDTNIWAVTIEIDQFRPPYFFKFKMALIVS
ncbi:RNA pyrophosphohydrolase [Bibersteinia trehalosi USDA-ARS-USMARC-190]|uniref:RNA pyrophosphohydrolase n=1 Tax=Bibersteinia trehalosi USDA-ARS-USMARC-190 TaxID=1263832 RepID=W0R9E0_BIBTR|nr:RNA pyrophosphohydrolase [Bibersteinia trehalosi USDA-ARS-USMARC-190]